VAIARLVGGAVTVLMLVQVPPAVADGGNGRPPASYFGMHYGAVSQGSWPDAPIGMIRLWDSGTTWREIQPARGVWSWAALDAAVETAEANTAKVTLVLGQTPRWAARRSCVGYYGAAAPSPPIRTAWLHYVRTVSQRFKGRIYAYEVWNEADIPGFWCGTAQQMVSLERATARVLRRTDPEALLVSATFVARDRTKWWLTKYLAAGGFRAPDIIGIHGYAFQESSPEEASRLIRQRLRLIKQAGVPDKPVWDTETNLGVDYPRAAKLSPQMQSAYVARTYLIGWDSGLAHVVFYSWDSTASYLGVHFTSRTKPTLPSAAGRAFIRVRKWMEGDPEPCRVGLHGVWRCRYTYGRVQGVIMWYPGGVFDAKAPAGAMRARDALGQQVAVGDRVVVGDMPVRVVRKTP
jgi:hypothetical protein